MKVKTSELTGPALRWAVAEAEWKGGVSVGCLIGQQIYCYDDGEKVLYEPDTNWAQGGPIIEKMHGYCMEYYPELPEDERFYCSTPSVAEVWHNHPVSARGGTTLVATMRCYVASKLGDEVDVPNELVK